MAKVRIEGTPSDKLDPRTLYAWLLAKIYEAGCDDESISFNIDEFREVWYSMDGAYESRTKAQMIYDIRTIFGEFMI